MHCLTKHKCKKLRAGFTQVNRRESINSIFQCFHLPNKNFKIFVEAVVLRSLIQIKTSS